MQTEASVAMPRRHVRSKLSVSAFLLLGCLQTIVAYFIFQRSDDHAYFLDIANHGLEAVTYLGIDSYDLKAQAAGLTFYILTAPSRWLGGSALTHLLWLRLLTLGGFVCAHRWVCRVLAPTDYRRTIRSSQTEFMVLCLLYPAQLAWTASLLRDGVSCAALFAALLAFSQRRWLVAVMCTAASLALRPEFALVLVMLMLTIPISRWLGAFRNRLVLLALAIAAISVAAFGPRSAASAFSIFAFSEAGGSYPAVQSILDVHGYLLVLIQAMLDPISIAGANIGLFSIAEVAFFSWITISALRRLNRAPAAAATLLMVDLAALWLFGYFELFISGFSRHRIALVIILIAVMSALRTRRPAVPRKLESSPDAVKSIPSIPLSSTPG
jgi:hypothetical protein